MNKFYTAFEARHVNSQDAAQYSNSNKIKAATLLSRLKSKSIVALLNASSVDAKTFDDALYMSEKVIKFAALADSEDFKSYLNDNLDAAFRTAMLCLRNNENVTTLDIQASMLNTHEVSDERKHLVFKRNARHSSPAQVQQCIDALQRLNIIKSVSKNVFSVHRNAIADKMIALLDLDMSNDNDDAAEGAAA